MGAKLSRTDGGPSGGGHPNTSPGSLSRRSLSLRLSRRTSSTLPSSLRDQGVSSVIPKEKNVSPKEQGVTSQTLPRTFDRGKSLSKRFRKSCRSWAVKKGLLDQGKAPETSPPVAEVVKQTEVTPVKSEPEEVSEEDDVSEEPEIDISVIVADLVVEAHKKKKLESKVKPKEEIEAMAGEQNEEELLQDSGKCEEETLTTLVETEAVVEIPVTREKEEIATSNILETETEMVVEERMNSESPGEDLDRGNHRERQDDMNEVVSQDINLLTSVDNVKIVLGAKIHNQEKEEKDEETNEDEKEDGREDNSECNENVDKDTQNNESSNDEKMEKNGNDVLDEESLWIERNFQEDTEQEEMKNTEETEMVDETETEARPRIVSSVSLEEVETQAVICGNITGYGHQEEQEVNQEYMGHVEQIELGGSDQYDGGKQRWSSRRLEIRGCYSLQIGSNIPECEAIVTVTVMSPVIVTIIVLILSVHIILY